MSVSRSPQEINARFFRDDPSIASLRDQPSFQCREAARGYGWPNDTKGYGIKTGGLTFAGRVVDLPAGSVLMRFYSRKDRALGEWWITAYQFDRIVRYFGMDAANLIRGQGAGKSGFHGVLAVMMRWKRDGPISQFRNLWVVQTTCPLKAWYGEGDIANWADYGEQFKPIRLHDGRAASQVFLPRAYTYPTAFQSQIDIPSHAVSSDRLKTIPTHSLGFETP